MASPGPAPAVPPTPAAPTSAPQHTKAPRAKPLGSLHISLASNILLAFERLGELGHALEMTESHARSALVQGEDLAASRSFVHSIEGEIEAMRDALRWAKEALSEAAHRLTGAEERSPLSQVIALARLETIAMVQETPLEFELAKEQASEAFQDF